MDIYNFDRGINKLSLFFSSFKPSSELRQAWFDKLRHFHDEAFTEAVEEIIYTLSKAPSFPEILAKVRYRERRFAIGDFWVSLSGGAPLTDEKRLLAKESMQQLNKALAMAAEQNNGKGKSLSEDVKAQLKEDWGNCYRQLPGYKSEAEVVRMVERGQFDEVYDLGLIYGNYKYGQGALGFRGWRE